MKTKLQMTVRHSSPAVIRVAAGLSQNLLFSLLDPFTSAFSLRPLRLRGEKSALGGLTFRIYRIAAPEEIQQKGESEQQEPHTTTSLLRLYLSFLLPVSLSPLYTV